METRAIGKSGMRASVVGLGLSNFGIYPDEAPALAVVRKALDVGITYFDMAAEHGSGAEETLFAKALGTHRKEVVISTKFGQTELLRFEGGEPVWSEDTARRGASRRWIMQSVEESLKRLNTDYIDVFQPHAHDPGTPLEETMRALDDLVQQGKVRAIGQAVNDSNEDAMKAANVEALISADDVAVAKGLTRFVSVQAQYNLLVRDLETTMLPAVRAREMSLFPYFPLANGLLTGKYRLGAPIPPGSRIDKMNFARSYHYSTKNLETVERLHVFAQSRGLSLVELAILWLLGEPLVASVISGATSANQVAQNAAAADKSLSAADRAEVSRLTAG